MTGGVLAQAVKLAAQIIHSNLCILSFLFQFGLPFGQFGGGAAFFLPRGGRLFVGSFGQRQADFGRLTSAQVTDIEVGLARGSMGNSAQVGIHQYPTIEAENIEVVPDA